MLLDPPKRTKRVLQACRLEQRGKNMIFVHLKKYNIPVISRELIYYVMSYQNVV